MIRITIACPAPDIYDANQLAACLGYSMADAETYSLPGWQTADGALYSCASLDVSDAWLTAAQQPLVRPAWDTENQIDMDAAAIAQAMVLLWLAGGETPPPVATPTALTVIAGLDGVAAVAAMGLAQVPTDEAA